MTKEEMQVLELLMTIMQTLQTDNVCDGFIKIEMKAEAIH